jgi:hypothetical protein
MQHESGNTRLHFRGDARRYDAARTFLCRNLTT